VRLNGERSELLARLAQDTYEAENLPRRRIVPPPRILHPWPDQRFAVTHPR
jgi:hypothetical protein